jgi:hypothetical protein
VPGEDTGCASSRRLLKVFLRGLCGSVAKNEQETVSKFGMRVVFLQTAAPNLY